MGHAQALLEASLRDPGFYPHPVGAVELRERRSGVAARGTLEVAYRACLWSRVGLRVLLPVARYAAPTPEALYAGARALD